MKDARVEDLGPDEIRECCFEGRTDRLRVNGIGRLVKAGREDSQARLLGQPG